MKLLFNEQFLFRIYRHSYMEVPIQVWRTKKNQKKKEESGVQVKSN